MSRKEDRVEFGAGRVAGAVAPGSVGARRAEASDAHFQTPLEHLILSGSTTGVLASDYLTALGIYDDVPDVQAHAIKRLLTVLTVNPVNRDRKEYSRGEEDLARIYSTREGVFIQGIIPCFDGLTQLSRNGLAIRIFLATIADPTTGETTGEWRVQLVRTKDAEGMPILLEKQHAVGGEPLDSLRLKPGGRAEAFFELDPIDPEDAFPNTRWLRLKEDFSLTGIDIS